MIGGDVGRVGGDGDRRRQGHRLPAARRGVGEGRAGELRAGRSPQIEHVGAGVAGAAVEFERGDLAGTEDVNFMPDFELRAVIEAGLRRRV